MKTLLLKISRHYPNNNSNNILFDKIIDNITITSQTKSPLNFILLMTIMLLRDTKYTKVIMITQLAELLGIIWILLQEKLVV